MTQRLILREIVAEDWQALYGIEREPAVVRYLTHDVATEDSIRSFVDRTIAATRAEPRLVYDLAITERSGAGRLVGRCGLGRKEGEPRVAALWYVLSPSVQGMGYATEAGGELLRFGFENLGLHRIYGDVDPRNPRSMRVLERLGLRREAHFVRDVWIKGEWCDTVIFGLLADEWSRLRR